MRESEEQARIVKLKGDRERDVQSAIKRLLKAMNLEYYDTSQPFRAAITAGVPDLLVFGKRHGFFVVEVKARNGRQSQAQQHFEELCKGAGIPYILGGVERVATFLNRQGPDT